MHGALRLLDRDQMDKQRALDAALGQIERAFGKGSIMKLGSREAAADTEVIPTGSLGLDIALGIGGLPRGRIVEIYGPESSGKTTLALHCIAEGQRGVQCFLLVHAVLVDEAQCGLRHPRAPYFIRLRAMQCGQLYAVCSRGGKNKMRISCKL